MGLFDVFSKGGKYFGKTIEPKCEYCEHGKRSSDGNKVLCPKKGMVDASSRCPKFVYSPLKRIPVKQLERVGFLDGDYDDVEEKKKSKAHSEEQKAAEAATAAPEPVKAAAPAPASPTVPASAPKSAAAMADDLAALAAAAEAAPEYAPTPAEETKPEENPSADVPPTLSSM